MNILEENYVTYFPNNTAQTCSMGWKFQGRLKRCLFYFRTYFHVFGIFHAGRINSKESLEASKKVKHSKKAETPLLHFSNKGS